MRWELSAELCTASLSVLTDGTESRTRAMTVLAAFLIDGSDRETRVACASAGTASAARKTYIHSKSCRKYDRCVVLMKTRTELWYQSGRSSEHEINMILQDRFSMELWSAEYCTCMLFDISSMTPVRTYSPRSEVGWLE